MTQAPRSIIHRFSGPLCAAGLAAILAAVALIGPAPMAEANSKYARHVACNEAWRASPAARTQQCKLRSVHWDSFMPGLQTAHRWDLQQTMQYSRCWIHVECPGPYWWQTARHNGAVPYRDVDRLTRCKHNPKGLEPGCEAVTEEQLRAWNFLQPHTHPKYAD